MDLVEKTLTPCKQAMADAGKTNAQIDEVVLVGGQTTDAAGSGKSKAVLWKRAE